MQKLVPRLVTTHGEIGQRDFWIGAAVLFGTGVIANLIPYLGTVASLLLLYPWACLALKRLRDVGRPESLAGVPVLLGLFSIIASLLTGFGQMVSAALAGVLLAVGGLAGLLALAFLVWLGLTPSRHGQPGGDASNLTLRM